jgi:hypothetical protein
MENKDITICLTSCGRFDLLEQSVKSLTQFWDGPLPEAFYINEDSGFELPKIISNYIKSIWPDCDYKEFAGLKNQIAAIDRMYKEVKTPYIFHTECDWQFYKTGFIEKSMDILENDPMIMQVWIRAQSDRNGHPVVGVPRMTPNRTRYQMMSSDYRGQWSGQSFNPGLRRLSDYKTLFPNGYAGVTTFNIKEPWTSEMQVGQVYKKAGFKAATLMNGYVKHIGGNGRHISS